MFKKLAKGLVIGGAALTIAATAAQAETYNINIYGASAQYTFWTEAAPEFLAAQGCDDADIYFAKQTKIEGRDTGLAVCYGGANGNGLNDDNNTYIIRYTTNASYDGIRAVLAADGFDQDGCGDVALRKQADLAGATLDSYASPTGTSAIASVSCQSVQIGASDVAAETFQQESTGKKYGHLGGSDEDRNITYPDFLIDPDETNPDRYAALEALENDELEVFRPVVVPFNFFANNGGKGNPEDGPQTTVDTVPFDNLSRLMAVSLFSGQVLNWNEFGKADDDAVHNLPVVVCMRHAGSGTVATLNAAVMRGDAGLPIKEINTGSTEYIWGASPIIWFNNGSSDMMRCVGQNEGAVGYADTDKCVDNCPSKVGDYGLVNSMKYMGYEGDADDIQNGKHDFWSAQWLYSNVADTDPIYDLVQELGDYAALGANIPSGKADYWSAQEDMNWKKDTDFAYPTKD